MADYKKKPQVDALTARLKSDPTARLKLLSRLTETLVELGVDPKDVQLLSALETIAPGLDPRNGEPLQFVFVHQSDAKKNTKTIIVGGGKPKPKE